MYTMKAQAKVLCQTLQSKVIIMKASNKNTEKFDFVYENSVYFQVYLHHGKIT